MQMLLLLFLGPSRPEREESNVWKLQGGTDTEVKREGSCEPLVLAVGAQSCQNPILDTLALSFASVRC